MNAKAYCDKAQRELVLERLVIGVEEPVLIKGIGEIMAKVDSGNSGYNVIHGEDFAQEGNILTFFTLDGKGNKKHVSKQIVDHIKVNIGSGNIQDRPVILLDIKFANEDYQSVPFSVTDRAENENKVLLSKNFVKDELDALIDVGARDISKENINVEETK